MSTGATEKSLQSELFMFVYVSIITGKSLEAIKEWYQIRHQSIFVGFINHIKGGKQVYKKRCCTTLPLFAVFGDFPEIVIFMHV